MGKVTSIITKEQAIILDEFKENRFLKSRFYFTGGTALSLYYLEHRVSEDLDFFSEVRFDPDIVGSIVEKWAQKYHFKTELRQVDNLTTFLLTFKNHKTVKLDFNFYPHKRVNKAKIIDGIKVDNLLDIAVNKLVTIIQRQQVKDFVDLYFLFKDFTLWDLIDGVKVKFGYKVDLLLISSDFLKVDSFEYLPRMIKPLKLETLKEFFRQKAKQMVKKLVI